MSLLALTIRPCPISTTIDRQATDAQPWLSLYRAVVTGHEDFVELGKSDISSAALRQTSPADSASAVTAVEQLNPTANNASLDSALQALGSAGKLSGDLQNVANALAPRCREQVAA